MLQLIASNVFLIFISLFKMYIINKDKFNNNDKFYSYFVNFFKVKT